MGNYLEGGKVARGKDDSFFFLFAFVFAVFCGLSHS